MSVKCMSWAWEIDGLKPSQKLVLLRLADHAQDDGICWPGKHHLATRCGISKRSVDTAIDALIERGLIRVKRRLNEQGQDTSNAYELQIIQADLFNPSGQNKPVIGEGAEIAPQGAKEVDGGAIHDKGEGAIGGAVVAPEPYNHNKRATVGADDPAARDYSDWKPAAAIVQRIKMMRPGITDEFLEDILPEFLTFAEGHYRKDQLDSKYLANANRQWFRSQNKPSSSGPPKDVVEILDWVAANNAPGDRPGESTYDYRKRLFKWIEDGRPAVNQSSPAAEVAAGAGLLDDHHADDMARMAAKEATG